ncbi:hypothetical protein [Baekduia sp.]|uniref:hypothetical protein n=1 Tax=Baekduia sp. TaxID=2600305 RepID=UPI002DFA1B93|nr:hypothetical protein [Baekduia sp.]
MAVTLGILLGVGFGWAVDRGAPPSVSAAIVQTVAEVPPSSSAATPARTATLPAASVTTQPVDGTPAGGDGVGKTVSGTRPDPALAAALQLSLNAGIKGIPGTVQAAVMMDGWNAPVLAGQRLADDMRPWSMVKAVTAVTLFSERLGRGTSTASVEEPLTRALTRSDNCAQREMTVQLERDLGGSLAATGTAIRAMLARVGAAIDIGPAQHNADGRYCITPTYKGLPAADASYPALLLGTTHWRVQDAIRFIHALRGQIAFGTAASKKILATLRLPKRNSQEPGAEAQLTAAPSWGAGAVFGAACWHLAYKAGWGGHAQGRFLAGQIGAVDLPGGHWIAFAVMFHPATQPPSDDPGLAHADQALASVLGSLKQQLKQRFRGSCA